MTQDTQLARLRFLLEELPVFTATSSVRLSKDGRQAEPRAAVSLMKRWFRANGDQSGTLFQVWLYKRGEHEFKLFEHV